MHEYLAKYASKGEPRSPAIKTAFDSIVRSSNTCSSPTIPIKKVVMKSLGQRDFSAQETMHHLMSLKLVSSSFNVISVSLNGSRKIERNSPDRDLVTSDSLLDVYAKSGKFAETVPNIMTLNFITFATKYKLVNAKLSLQTNNTIPRVFPVFPNLKGQHYPLHCKYQLLRYKPWNTTQDNVWGDQPGTDQLYIDRWKDFLESSYAKEHIPDWHEKTQSFQNQFEKEEDIEHFQQEIPQRQEWKVLADLVPEYFVTRDKTQQTADSDYVWQSDKLNIEKIKSGKMSSWLKTSKDLLNPAVVMPKQSVDINTFSYEQNMTLSRTIQNKLFLRKSCYL